MFLRLNDLEVFEQLHAEMTNQSDSHSEAVEAYKFAYRDKSKRKTSSKLYLITYLN